MTKINENNAQVVNNSNESAGFKEVDAFAFFNAVRTGKTEIRLKDYIKK